MPTACLVPAPPADDPAPAPATIAAAVVVVVAAVVPRHSPTAVSSGEEGIAGSGSSGGGAAEPTNNEKKKSRRAAAAGAAGGTAGRPRGSKIDDIDQATTTKEEKTKKEEETKRGGGAAPFVVDLVGVPPQPLVLKNALSGGGGGMYEDNTRRRPIKAGSSRYTGVYLDKGVGKWKAQIMVDGCVRSIGYYDREEDAAAVYARAAFKYKKKVATADTFGGLDLGDVPERPLITGNGASGFWGVKNVRGRWQARIVVERGESARTLGTFDTVEEAASIYSRAEFYLERR